MSRSKAATEDLRLWLLRGALPDVTDEVASAAADQGLAALLLAALDGLPGRAPDVALGRLKEASRARLVRGVRLLDLCERARAALGRRGVRSLPLKGAAVSEWLYDSPALRPMLDADLLVLDAWPDAVQALLEEGYRDAAGADHASVFVDPVTGGILELHRSVTSCPGLFDFDRDGLWSRSLPAAGLVTRRPGAEDLLIQLSMHASFQHGLVLSLVQWLDFRRLLEKRSLDTELCVALAAASGAGLAVGAALEAARIVVGAPVPESLREALPLPARFASWLGARAREPLAFVSPAEAPLARVRFELVPGRRLALVAQTLRARPSSRGTLFGRGSRAARLVRRWALPSARTWRGAVS